MLIHVYDGEPRLLLYMSLGLELHWGVTLLCSTIPGS